MSTNKRAIDYWFIPKRVNVHQMVSIIKALTERGYDGTTWNASKQDNISLDLSKMGATNSGKKISNQAIRTLLASLTYLGFTYLDNTVTPSTINLTEAGRKLYEENQHLLLEPINNLRVGPTIDTSEMFKFQFSKLQITNPNILKDCIDIFVFPFRVTLKLLLELKYLTVEEIALYVFKIANMDEVNYKEQEIINFRNLKEDNRKKLVTEFEKTTIGNISLVKAPSAGYFIRFCVTTGAIEEFNKDGKRSIRIKEDYIEWVEKILHETSDIEAYDFGSNQELWIEYIGNVGRKFTPTNLKIINDSPKELYIEIFNNKNKLVETDILSEKNSNNFTGFDDEERPDIVEIPVFQDEEYIVSVYDIVDSALLYNETIVPQRNDILKISIDDVDEVGESLLKMSLSQISNEIINHNNSKDFHGYMRTKLDILKTKLDLDYFGHKHLRGAVLEYYFYLLLSKLRDSKIIDEVQWNGKLGKYNLPTAAPGGKRGTPDIVFIINNERYLLELTTIKSKTGQNPEVTSVIDHIRVYSRDFPNVTVKGIFSAPIIHERNHSIMSTTAASEKLNFSSIEVEELLVILIESNSKEELKGSLNKIF